MNQENYSRNAFTLVVLIGIMAGCYFIWKFHDCVPPGRLKPIPTKPDMIYTVEEAYVRENEINQEVVRVKGYLRSEANSVYLIGSPWSEKKLVIPDFPFMVERCSWSRRLIVTGKYQMSGEVMIDNALSPISMIEVDHDADLKIVVPSEVNEISNTEH